MKNRFQIKLNWIMIEGKYAKCLSSVDRSKEINEVKNSRQLNEYEATEHLDKIAEGLSAGNIYARWDGNEEFGARALAIDLLLPIQVKLKISKNKFNNQESGFLDAVCMYNIRQMG